MNVLQLNLRVRMEESVWMVSMDSPVTVWMDTQDTHARQVYTVWSLLLFTNIHINIVISCVW